MTVFGTGLDPTSGITAQVGGTSAQIASGTDTELGILVPAGAASGPISVNGPAGQASSQADLYIPPTGVTVDQVAVAQRVESGAPVSVALPAAGQVGLLTMALSAGDRIAVAITNSTFGNSTSYAKVSVLAPDGTAVVAPTGFASSGVFLEPSVATEDGTYTVFIDPQGTKVGSANVTVYRVPDDVVVSAVAGGDPVTVSTSVPGQNGKVVFAGTSGQQVAVSLSGSTLGTSSTAVQVLKPDGSVLKSMSFSGTSAFIDTFILPSAGDYTIMINPYRAAVGSVNALVSDVSSVQVDGAADGGEVVVSTGLAGQNGEVTFDAVAGDRVAVQTVASTYGTSSSTIVKLSLVSPSGVTAISATSAATGYFIEPVVLSESGTYRLVVNPQGSTTGSVSLRLHTVPADVVVSAVAGGDPVTVSTSVPGQNGKVVLAGTSGQQVAVSLSGSTLGTSSTAVQVLKPDGSVLKSMSFSGTSAFIDTFILPSAGDYTMVVNPYRAVIGSVSVLVSDVPSDVSLDIGVGGAVVVADVTSPGQNVRLSTELVAGKQYTLYVHDMPGTTTVSVRNSAGTAVFTRSLSWPGWTSFTVTTAGAYTISVDPQGELIGSWNLELFSGAGAPTMTLPATDSGWHTSQSGLVQ